MIPAVELRVLAVCRRRRSYNSLPLELRIPPFFADRAVARGWLRFVGDDVELTERGERALAGARRAAAMGLT